MAIFSAAKTRLFQPNFADPGQDHDAMAGLHPAIIVAVIGAVMVANTAKQIPD